VTPVINATLAIFLIAYEFGFSFQNTKLKEFTDYCGLFKNYSKTTQMASSVFLTISFLLKPCHLEDFFICLPYTQVFTFTEVNLQYLSILYIISLFMKQTYFMLLCLFSITFGFAQAPITTIDRLNGPGPTATDNVASVSSIGLTRGAGLNQAGADGLAAFISNNYSNTPPGDLAAAQANDDYLQWSVTANTAFEVTVDDIDIRLRRNDNGPSNWQIFLEYGWFCHAGKSRGFTRNLSG
jgi:hypothetical protein